MQQIELLDMKYVIQPTMNGSKIAKTDITQRQLNSVSVNVQMEAPKSLSLPSI